MMDSQKLSRNRREGYLYLLRPSAHLLYTLSTVPTTHDAVLTSLSHLTSISFWSKLNSFTQTFLTSFLRLSRTQTTSLTTENRFECFNSVDGGFMSIAHFVAAIHFLWLRSFTPRTPDAVLTCLPRELSWRFFLQFFLAVSIPYIRCCCWRTENHPVCILYWDDAEHYWTRKELRRPTKFHCSRL